MCWGFRVITILLPIRKERTIGNSARLDLPSREGRSRLMRGGKWHGLPHTSFKALGFLGFKVFGFYVLGVMRALGGSGFQGIRAHPLSKAVIACASSIESVPATVLHCLLKGPLNRDKNRT